MTGIFIAGIILIITSIIAISLTCLIVDIIIPNIVKFFICKHEWIEVETFDSWKGYTEHYLKCRKCGKCKRIDIWRKAK